jgi:cyclophilin family peptidyl-prolyl cis-trans isomerase
MRFRPVLLLALCLFLALSALSMADPQPAASPPAKRGPQTEEFYRRMDELKALDGQLSNLSMKYATANEEKRSELKIQYQELKAKGEKLEPVLIDAAEKAYAEAPNSDTQITDFLMALVYRWVQRDDFEPAYRVGKLLMDGKCDNKALPTLAGVAAFCVSDFGTAEKYLKAALAKKVALKVGDPKVLEKYYNNGGYPLDNLIDAFMRDPDHFKRAWEKEKAIREEEAKSDNLPRVLLKTSKGDIELELFENESPKTVGNFISLVESGFYNGVQFHRVLPGFMALGGDPKATGSGGPGYRIPCECYQPNHRNHFRGVLSMAKEGVGGSDGRGRDTGGSQFFLTFVPTAMLDGNYTVFGRVLNGWDVLAKIQRINPEDPEKPRADKIIEAKVIRKRPHDYKPEKMPE